MLVGALAEALSPGACAACDTELPARSVFCVACASTVVRSTGRGGPHLLRIASFASFGGAVAVALRRFKYADRPDLAFPLGELARRAARQVARVDRPDVVVPVPLHPRRLAERGYNQAGLLAAPVAAELGVPLVPAALARLRNTPQQARLDRAGRRRNMAGAFVVASAGCLAGRRVLVVDDVATSGATLDACRAALLDSGAEAVDALVVARAEAGEL